MTRNIESEIDQVQLPSHLVERIESRLPHTGFDDANEYVAYVVEDVLAQVEDRVDDVENDREELESRLKSLGYLE